MTATSAMPSQRRCASSHLRPGSVTVRGCGGSTGWWILYDGDCGFCKWSLDKILRWDRRRCLRPAAIQSADGQALLSGMAEEKRFESWHLVSPSGEVRSAGAAAAPLAELLPGARPLACLFRQFPRTTERAYRYVADHRDPFAKLARVDTTCQIRR